MDSHLDNDGTSPEYPQPEDVVQQMAREQRLLWRLVVAVALIVGAGVIASLAATHGYPVWATAVALYSGIAAVTVSGTILIGYWIGYRRVPLLVVDLVAALAAVLDVLVLITPAMWR